MYGLAISKASLHLLYSFPLQTRAIGDIGLSLRLNGGAKTFYQIFFFSRCECFTAAYGRVWQLFVDLKFIGIGGGVGIPIGAH